MKKVFLILLCLLPIPLANSLYEEAVAIQMGMGFASFIAGVCILVFQKNIKEFKWLSLVQFIGKMAGHAIAGTLFLKNVSGDGESQAIILGIAFFSAISSLIQFIIGYFISRKMKRNKVQ